MPQYKVYVTYLLPETFEVGAEDDEDAIES